MQAVLSVEEMRAVDAEALGSVSEETLVERAGTAVATWAVRLLGGTYGRRVVVVAGKGNNGADGRVAAQRLRRRGARVTVLEAADAPEHIGPAGVVDLVVDAAYGTGFRGTYRAPSVPPGVPVLAVDIPSGVNGDTGEASGAPLRADLTVTFAAYKPGLLQGAGPLLAGRVVVADIGLDVGAARTWVVEDADVPARLPHRQRDAHKWLTALAVVAGSPGMTGAAALCARAAYRAGAGMVRLGIPGCAESELPVSEAVGVALPAAGWAAPVLETTERCRALVIGPGLGRVPATVEDVRTVVSQVARPTVVDADGLYALGSGVDLEAAVEGAASSRSPASVILTPHDGEFARLAGRSPGVDRIGDTQRLAARTGAVVLLKGPVTVVAHPSGGALLATAGSPRLATAGTGDVLSGVVGAFAARGLDLWHAGALGAHVHGRAAELGPTEGLVAGDLVELVARWLSGVRRG